MLFDEYQRRALATDQNPGPHSDSSLTGTLTIEPTRHEVIPLLGLVGEVGGLLSEYKKRLRDGEIHHNFRDQVAEELGDSLWYLANVASKFGLSLSQIATQNLQKTEDRWGHKQRPRTLYDAALPESQRLPREFEYRFEHRDVGGRRRLVLTDVLRGGVQIGDALTDNAYDEDGYRFHDVFHLTFGAMLGWSPVWRKLLRKAEVVTNREPPEVADAEDGGRGQVIDEAIVAAVYVYGSNHKDLVGATAVDWQLLRHIQQLTEGVEVSSRTTREWNDAILRAFEMWRELRHCNGGVVRGDLLAGTITFSKA
jgi:NTP pyrophosphatase (non-canonical NTP hydrolase)